jgi:hypothetical protein
MHPLNHCPPMYPLDVSVESLSIGYSSMYQGEEEAPKGLEETEDQQAVVGALLPRQRGKDGGETRTAETRAITVLHETLRRISLAKSTVHEHRRLNGCKSGVVLEHHGRIRGPYEHRPRRDQVQYSIQYTHYTRREQVQYTAYTTHTIRRESRCSTAYNTHTIRGESRCSTAYATEHNTHTHTLTHTLHTPLTHFAHTKPTIRTTSCTTRIPSHAIRSIPRCASHFGQTRRTW